MNGIESVIQSGQPPKAGSATVPGPLKDLMGLVKYLMEKRQGGAPSTPTVAEGIASAAAEDIVPPELMNSGMEAEPEPDMQGVMGTALPAMQREDMMNQNAMRQAAEQIQQQNRPPAGISSLEPDIIPLRAGGILGYDDDEAMGFSPGGLTPEFAGMEAPQEDEPRVEAFGPGGKRGRFTAEELRRMGYSEEEIKRRFAATFPRPAAPAPAPQAAPAKPPLPIVKVPNAGPSAPAAPSMAPAEPPEVNPFESKIMGAINSNFDMAQPTLEGITAGRTAALQAAGIKGPAMQRAESGIAELQKMMADAAKARPSEKDLAKQELVEFLIGASRGSRVGTNFANAAERSLKRRGETQKEKESFQKLQLEQKKLIIQMEDAVDAARRAEALNDYQAYQHNLDRWQQLKKAFDNTQMHLIGQGYQVAEQAATRREATAARRDIANQQAQMRAALARAKGIGAIKPRDELALRQDVNSKFFSGVVSPELRSYLSRTEDGKRVLNDIANGRVKYDPRTGWGAAESAVARAAAQYKQDLMASIGRDSGIPSAAQAARELGDTQ